MGNATMFDHLLVALDLSPAADPMLGCLQRLQAFGAKRLTLVHVARVEYPVFGSVANLDHYRERLEAMVPGLEAQGFRVEVVTAVGNPAPAILQTARQVGASLLLVGSRSESRIREAFIGSVALGVVRRSPIPVLLQRLEPRSDLPHGPLAPSCCDLRSHILFPTDFSDTAEQAFLLAEAMAQAGSRAFTLLHVIVEDQAEPGHLESARAGLNTLADRLRRAGATAVTPETVTGDPAAQILGAASDHPDVLIVMGTQGRGMVAEAVLGSVSLEVMRRAPCSVLLAPGRP